MAGKVTYEVLGFEVFLPGNTSEFLFFKQHEEELKNSENEFFQRVAREGRAIDAVINSQTGGFMVRDGNFAVDYFGMAKKTFFKESILTLPANQILQ